ncbi:3'-phosphoadenosine 5'-phosphate phosphatase [Sphingomonas antarctica]|uniref:3'(2'),5'-bisphosphate nucleotidase CysQ n=1 Tax=Sphingomonas antarctica TaxID=2040274 RepID=UPI0039E9F94C
MTLGQAQDRSDAQLAREIACGAGSLLLELRKTFSGAEAGREGDAQANALIVERLLAERPEDALLSEERLCDGARLKASRVWIVDPLDGTREYAEGRDDWAVHIGLAIDGVPTVGAVSIPARNECWSSDAPYPPHPIARPLRMVVSRTRPAKEALMVAEALGAEMLPMGSAGAKAMAVVRGDAEIYLHTGGQYEWDNCAPAAVALAAGLHVSRVDGAPLVYNCEDPSLPDLLICRHELAEPILHLLAKET